MQAESDGQMLINNILGLVAEQLDEAESGGGFKTRAHRAGTRSMLSTLKRAAKTGRVDPTQLQRLRGRWDDLQG